VDGRIRHLLRNVVERLATKHAELQIRAGHAHLRERKVHDLPLIPESARLREVLANECSGIAQCFDLLV